MPDKIELSAAIALVEWKSHFAKLVKEKALEIAKAEGVSTLTRTHYETAAFDAAIQLSKSFG